jgi:hypothetical protein
MRKSILVLLCSLFVSVMFAATSTATATTNGAAFNVESSTALTLKERVALKTLKKAIKSPKATTDDGITKPLYILLAILGLGWIAMAVLDDFSGTDWIISLLLYALFYLPGLIYTLVKMKKYYS